MPTSYELRPSRRRRFTLLIASLFCVVLTLGSGVAVTELSAQQTVDNQQTTNNVVIELFYRSDSEQSQNAEKYIREFRDRPGIEVITYDVLKDQNQLKRLWQLSRRFGMEKAKVPAFYLCDRLQVGFPDEDITGPQLEELLTIKAYIRPGCKHCKAGKEFLDEMVKRWPALKVQYFDVIADVNARREVQNLATQFRTQVPSFPCIKVAGRLVVGFQTAEITGTKIEVLFQDRSVDFPTPQQPKADKPESDASSDGSQQQLSDENNTEPELSAYEGPPKIWPNVVSEPVLKSWLWLPVAVQTGSTAVGSHSHRILKGSVVDFSYPSAQSESIDSTVDKRPQNQDKKTDNTSSEDVPLPDDALLPEDFQLPEEAGDQTVISGGLINDGEIDEIEVPWFGRLSVSKMGLPAFTFLIGLVDGFNPCAMWVLIFLLSVLVNIKERKKIIIVAGTFVVISGLAYFVFMAAWFNVFQLIGFLRPVQIGLGIVAIIVGLINVKDFFAFHKGITLSIPESAKPGIYQRVRKIVSANHLTAALSGAIVLAIVVNIVELLCTAGLPALYTQVLAMQKLPAWANYSYLALYISAYMLDDTILVIIVVSTLSRRRLQESQGRWLKLLSGVVILTLGIVMIFWPEALV